MGIGRIALVSLALAGCVQPPSGVLAAPEPAASDSASAPATPTALVAAPAPGTAAHPGAGSAPTTPAPAAGATGTERCVTAEMKSFIRTHQAADGSWPCASFLRVCGHEGCRAEDVGAGASDADTPATTALMTLAFLGAGHSIRAGRYKDATKGGVKYLVSIQRADGGIGADLYAHAMATFALVEALDLSGQPESLRAPAQNAVAYLLASQAGDGAWRAVSRGRGDTCLTVWSVLALFSARLAEIPVPDQVFGNALWWFDRVTDPHTGAVGWHARYDTGPRPADVRWAGGPETLTAGVLACRMQLGGTRDDQAVAVLADRLRRVPPAWDPAEGRDLIAWYFGTLGMFRLGGEDWKAWNAGVREALIKTQRRGGHFEATWDPSDLWGAQGGRLYSTAVSTLALEVYYRYGKVLGAANSRAVQGK